MTRGLSIAALALLTVAGGPVSAGQAAAGHYPAAYPRPGATKLIDNDRVVVWDATWEKGKPTPLHEHAMDLVAVFLADGPRRLTAADGTITVPTRLAQGGVAFLPKGTVHSEERTGDPAPHAIAIELKPATGRPTTSPIPKGSVAAFPRPGSKKV